MKKIFAKDNKLLISVLIAVLCSIILISIDRKAKIAVKLRSHLDALSVPFFIVVNAPHKILDSTFNILQSKNTLEKENAALKEKLLIREVDLQRLSYLQDENRKLRSLLNAPLFEDENYILVEAFANDMHPYIDQIVINQGTNRGIKTGFAVVDQDGVLGQVSQPNPLASSVILICNSSHALHVQVLNKNLRTIVYGKGCDKSLELEPLAPTEDIEIGDILVTSGLGGSFPKGYPIGKVSSIFLDSKKGAKMVKVTPLAQIHPPRKFLLVLQPTNLKSKIEDASWSNINQTAKDRIAMCNKIHDI